MHAVVAEKLAARPALLAMAKRNIARWKKLSSNPPACLDEWLRVLARPLPEILSLLTAMDERSTRLRQSSPFVGVLTVAERSRIFDAFRA